MANEQSGIPLRRWRPFFGAFVAIDEAIEAAGHPRSAFEDVTVQILRLLRAATDDGVAEQLCAALDDAMAEALQTLRVAAVPQSALASTDLARAVGALGKHGSARIRDLASDVMRGWRKANVAARAAAAKEIHKLSGDPIPCRGIAEGNVRGSVVPTTAAEVHKKKLFTNKPIVSQSDKLETKKLVVAQGNKLEAKNKKPIAAQIDKMETTKRKLHEGYEEAKRLKRQHIIQKIEDKEAPKLLELSQRKMHGPARCRISSGVRRSLLPPLQ